MSRPDLDTLIIGQGLAGSALAWQLIHAGQRVCVLDDAHATSSSTVAAGMINPLAGMRFNRRPELDDWMAAAERWYTELARALRKPLLHRLPMLRLFRSPQQVRFYERQAARSDAATWIGGRFDAASCPEPVRAPHGGFVQHRTGFVDLPGLLQGLRNWLAARDAVRTIAVRYHDIEPVEHGVAVAGMRARRLVFCDGARLHDNPWFTAAALAPDKGEILDLAAGDWQPRYIINGACWLVPQPGSSVGRMRLGATHDHDRIDAQPSAQGRRELLDRYAALVSPHAATVTRHRAGIRPGTRDRYPLLGAAAARPELLVFNGFGARGALTVPWYAARMTAHLVHGAALPAEADIRRFD